MNFVVRRAFPYEWEQSRALRLEMLADTPYSFGDRLDDVLQWDEDRWRIRHTSHLLPDSGVYVAVNAAGEWVGHMAVCEFRNYSPARALLMGVYVTPAHRGDGTAGALLEAVESWVVERGFHELYLVMSMPSRRRDSTSATGLPAPDQLTCIH